MSGKTTPFNLEASGSNPGISLEVDGNQEYFPLRPEAAIRIDQPGMLAYRNFDPDELLALARGAMEARAKHIAHLEAWGIKEAAERIWSNRTWHGIGP